MGAFVHLWFFSRRPVGYLDPPRIFIRTWLFGNAYRGWTLAKAQATQCTQRVTQNGISHLNTVMTTSPDPREIQKRRRFLQQATTSIGLFLSAPVLASIVQSCEYNETQPSQPTTTVTYDVSSNPDLGEVGGIAIDMVPGLNNDQPVFISRIATDVFAVFSAICTHQGCTVNPPTQAGADCICPCHQSQYSSTDGRILKQPTIGSATDLPKFASQYDANTHILSISS